MSGPGSTRTGSAAQRSRSDAILGWLEQQGRLEVADTASRLGVAVETVRRDLRRLEREGRLRRAHGGAIPAADPRVPQLRHAPDEQPDVDAAEPNATETIAAEAVRLLPEQGAVLLDSGPAAEALAARFPNDRRLLVATTSVAVAVELSRHPGLDVYNLGGRVEPGSTAQTGDWPRRELQRLHVHTAFVTPTGLDPRHGLTSDSAETAAVRAAMLAAADTVVALAEHTVAGRARFVRFAELSELDVVITDERTPERLRAAMWEYGPQVFPEAAGGCA